MNNTISASLKEGRQFLFFKNSRFYISATVLIASLLYYLSYAKYGFINSDWGMIVVAAERFLRGEVFYRDFSILYTPGIYIYTALAFKLFGISLSSATIGWSILRAFNCLLIYLIGTELMSRRAALMLPLLLWFVPGVLHKSFFIFFVLLDSFILIRLLVTNSRVFYFLSGIVAVITLLFRVDLFGFFVITLLLVEVLKITWSGKKISGTSQIVMPLKNISFFTSGAIVGAIPLLLYLVSNSALKDAYHQTIDYATTMGSMWFYLPPISQLFSLNLGAIFKYLSVIIPFLLYFLVFIILLSIMKAGDFNEKDKRLLIIFLFGCMTLNQTIIWPGMGRISQVLSPVLIANVYLILRYYNSYKNGSHKKFPLIYPITLAGLSLVLFLYIAFSCIFRDIYLNGSIFMRFKNPVLLSNPKLNVYTEYEEAKEFNRVSDVIKNITAKDEYVFTYPGNPQMYFFATGRKNLDKYSIITEYIKSEERQKRVIGLLEEKNVRLIISDLTDKRGSLSPILDRYVKEHYEPGLRVGNYLFLRKKREIDRHF
jgi:hypothetical protein